MNHRQNMNLRRMNLVDNTILENKEFPDILVVLFRDHPTEFRKLSQSLRGLKYPLNGIPRMSMNPG